MTAWVIYQNTDFCPTQWEERFYNAVVGIILCFCFFNVKEGRSRHRLSFFYSVIIVENFGSVAWFYFVSSISQEYSVAASLGLIVFIGKLLHLHLQL